MKICFRYPLTKDLKMASALFEKLSDLFITVKAEEEDEPEEEEEEEDEEDLIDPATAIKEACAENHCTSYKAKLDECEERVSHKIQL